MKDFLTKYIPTRYIPMGFIGVTLIAALALLAGACALPTPSNPNEDGDYYINGYETLVCGEGRVKVLPAFGTGIGSTPLPECKDVDEVSESDYVFKDQR